MIVIPINEPGKHRTGKLDRNYTDVEIAERLGFLPNVQDDPDKVKHSWGFLADGYQCGIWDYEGTRWSTYGPREVFDYLFPDK